MLFIPGHPVTFVILTALVLVCYWSMEWRASFQAIFSGHGWFHLLRWNPGQFHACDHCNTKSVTCIWIPWMCLNNEYENCMSSVYRRYLYIKLLSNYFWKNESNDLFHLNVFQNIRVLLMVLITVKLSHVRNLYFAFSWNWATEVIPEFQDSAKCLLYHCLYAC